MTGSGRARGARGVRRRRSRGALVATLVGAWLVAAALPAAAHPLGNFSVNHFNGLTLTPEGIDLLAVVDSAEIPTSQDLPTIDADGDGAMSSSELASAADRRCPELAQATTTTVGGRMVEWRVRDATLTTSSGAAGLPTLRLSCRLDADVAISERTTVSFSDGYRGDRVGWHEITATGRGVRLVDPPVGPTSISDELREYPEDLLSSPLDVRQVTLVAEPGSAPTATDDQALGASGDPFGRFVASGDRLLQDTIGRGELTALVGGLAVLLAMLLGAGHAVLPGHGKTVMAAYLAGRRGTRADALIVGATVTLTHTAGVLVLGLVLTLGSAVAGEVVLQRLGLLSGLLIAGIGVSLVRDAIRARRGHADHVLEESSVPAVVGAASVASAGEPRRPVVVHDQLRQRPHGHEHGHAHGHAHGHSHGHSHAHDVDPRFSRRGLVGMAMAGGLVPSPSALVVLLGSIALGRTLFGVALVLAYGVGMAGTLTVVGLLLVRLRDRLDGVRAGRMGRLAARASGVVPIATAALVLVVGVGLVARGLLFPA